MAGRKRKSGGAPTRTTPARGAKASSPQKKAKTETGDEMAAPKKEAKVANNATNSSKTNASSVYDFTVKDMDGNDVSLEKYRGHPLLIVNVASRCGYTKRNYEQLNELYAKHKDAGLKIAGFPCNQFGGQEPGTCEKIKEFLAKRDVEWDVYGKIDVNGAKADPLYEYLKDQKQDPKNGRNIKWNFNKFLIDKNGKVVERYASPKNPLDIEPDIVPLLK